MDYPVFEAVRARKSTRGFLPKPVDRTLIHNILDTARWAPSGTNTQPWLVYMIDGAARQKLSQRIQDAYQQGVPGEMEYTYSLSQWRDPYQRRRRATGFGLYNHLGIARDDKEARFQQAGRNYDFFDAPTGLFFCLEKDLGPGAWLDLGLYMQSVMLMAHDAGLATCPQQAFSSYYGIIKQALGIPEAQILVTGMAMGYEDKDAHINKFRPERDEVAGFLTVVEELEPNPNK